MKPWPLLLAFGPALIFAAAFGRNRGYHEVGSKGFPPGFGGLTRDGVVRLGPCFSCPIFANTE